jgi:hypothetical protein
MNESDHGRGAGQDSETHRVSLSLMFAVEAQAGDLWMDRVAVWLGCLPGTRSLVWVQGGGGGEVER